MFTTPEVIDAEIGYRLELARDAARRALVARPSLLRRLWSRTPRVPSTPRATITRDGPLSAGV